MEIRVLQYFMAVAKHENITKAAEELHLTQPTLSRQLTDLEEELGVQLLVRGKRKTQLTEAGLMFKTRAQEILSLTEKTKEQFAKLDELVAGDIYIGAGETEAMACLAKVLAPLRRSYPHIRFHLVSGNEDLIYDYLQKGLLDFGLVCRADAPRMYVFRRIPHDDVWGLMMRADNPLAAKEVLTRADLVEEPLILSEQAMKRHELDHYFGSAAEKIEVAGTYNLLYNTIFFIEAGIGSALCFKGMADAVGTSRGLVFRPLEPELRSANYVVWRRDQVFSRAGRLVVAALDEVFSNHA
jgi:DNA-binding transcriptional LysR family regulator|nr:LysR family transcriptional regulator [Mitsuokella multacida]